MKKIIFSLLLVLFTVNAVAQRGDGGQRGDRSKGEGKMSMEDRQVKELEELTEALSLTPEQVIDVKKLQESFTSTMQEKRESMGEDVDREKMREEMTALRTKYTSDINLLLDEEQQAKYVVYLKEQEEKMSQRQSRGERPGGGDRSGGGQR